MSIHQAREQNRTGKFHQRGIWVLRTHLSRVTQIGDLLARNNDCTVTDNRPVHGREPGRLKQFLHSSSISTKLQASKLKEMSMTERSKFQMRAGACLRFGNWSLELGWILEFG